QFRGWALCPPPEHKELPRQATTGEDEMSVGAEVTVSEKADQLHRQAIVIDGLIGTMQNLDPVLAGGITAGNVTLASSSTQDPIEVFRKATEYHDLARVYPDKFL